MEPLILLAVLAASGITIGIAVLYLLLIGLSALTILGIFRQRVLRTTSARPK